MTSLYYLFSVLFINPWVELPLFKVCSQLCNLGGSLLGDQGL